MKNYKFPVLSGEHLNVSISIDYGDDGKSTEVTLTLEKDIDGDITRTVLDQDVATVLLAVIGAARDVCSGLTIGGLSSDVVVTEDKVQVNDSVLVDRASAWWGNDPRNNSPRDTFTHRGRSRALKVTP